MAARDDLATLIRDTIRARFVHDDSPEDVAYISDDDPISHVFVDGYLDLRAAADAILARWRLTPNEECADCKQRETRPHRQTYGPPAMGPAPE